MAINEFSDGSRRMAITKFFIKKEIIHELEVQPYETLNEKKRQRVNLESDLRNSGVMETDIAVDSLAATKTMVDRS